MKGAILVLTAEHGAVNPATLLRSYLAGAETRQQTDLAELSFAQASSQRSVGDESGKSASGEERKKEMRAAHGDVKMRAELCCWSKSFCEDKEPDCVTIVQCHPAAFYICCAHGSAERFHQLEAAHILGNTPTQR